MDWLTLYDHFLSFRGELDKLKKDNPSLSQELKIKIDDYQLYLDILKTKLIDMGVDSKQL